MAQTKKPAEGRYEVKHSLVGSFTEGTIIDPKRHLPGFAENPDLLNRLLSLGAIERVDDNHWVAGQTDVYGDPVQDPENDARWLGAQPTHSLATGADLPADPLTRATIEEKAATGDMGVTPKVKPNR